MQGLSAGSLCPGSSLLAGVVCTLACVSDPASTEAAEAAAEPPSDVGGVFVPHSIQDRGMADQGMKLCWDLHGHETTCGAEERRLAASPGARHEGRT